MQGISEESQPQFGVVRKTTDGVSKRHPRHGGKARHALRAQALPLKEKTYLLC
jgi:hypothetical protein